MPLSESLADVIVSETAQAPGNSQRRKDALGTCLNLVPRGDDFIAIAGTKKEKYLRENMRAVERNGSHRLDHSGLELEGLDDYSPDYVSDSQD